MSVGGTAVSVAIGTAVFVIVGSGVNVAVGSGSGVFVGIGVSWAISSGVKIGTLVMLPLVVTTSFATQPNELSGRTIAHQSPSSDWPTMWRTSRKTNW